MKADLAVVRVLALLHGSNCLMALDIIRSCKSAATFEIVKIVVSLTVSNAVASTGVCL